MSVFDTEVVKPLTHEERRAVIEAPLLCRVIGSYRWGGTGTSDWFKDHKERAYTYRDERGLAPWLRIRK
jgi:hypothetical protein